MLPLWVSVFSIQNVQTLDKFWKSDAGEVELQDIYFARG